MSSPSSADLEIDLSLFPNWDEENVACDVQQSLLFSGYGFSLVAGSKALTKPRAKLVLTLSATRDPGTDLAGGKTFLKGKRDVKFVFERGTKMAPPNKKQKSQRPWQDIAKEAQDHRDATLAQVKPGRPELFAEFEEDLENIQSNPLKGFSVMTAGKVLHPDDANVTEMLPEKLLPALASGELSATNVTTAFLRRAVIAQKLVSFGIYSIPDLIFGNRRTASLSSFLAGP